MADEFKIVHEKLVFVEGVDDVRILDELCKHLGIADVQVNQCGGYQNLARVVETYMALPDFDRVKSLAVIVDADQNIQGRRQSVADTLAQVGLPRPNRPLEPVSESGLTVAYLVVPHDGDGTMMEDVCLSSVADDPAMACVDRYFECLDETGAEAPNPVWAAKARVHAFLASRSRPDLRLGEAAQRGVWNFGDAAFSALTQLVRML